MVENQRPDMICRSFSNVWLKPPLNDSEFVWDCHERIALYLVRDCRSPVIRGSSRVGRSPVGFQGAAHESQISGIYVGTSVVADEGLGILVENLQRRFLLHLFGSSMLLRRLVLLVGGLFRGPIKV